MASFASAGVRAQHRAQTLNTNENRQAILQIQGLIQQQQLGEAKKLAEATLAKFPKDGGVENLLGIIAASSHDPAHAASYFEAAVKHRPDLTSANLNLARLYLENPTLFPQAEDKARQVYVQALTHDSHSEEAIIELALIEERHSQYKAALAHLDALPASDRQSTLSGALRCAAYAATGESSQANSVCAALAGSASLAEDDAMIAARGLREGARPDLILRLLNAVQQRQPLSPAGIRMLALAQDASGDSQAAQKTLEQAFADSPRDAQLLLDLADVSERVGKLQESLGYLAHARDLRPQLSEIDYRFAKVCIALKLLGEARNAMQRALAIEPENPGYNLLMGKVTALSQDPLSAKPFLEKYNRLRPADAQGPLLLGVIEYRVLDFEAARPWLLQAAKNPATAAEANLYLGGSARQAGQLPEAQMYLRLSAQGDPKDPEVHAELGLVATQQRDFAAAEHEFAEALRLDPRSYSGNYGLLQLYARTNDPRRAAQLERFNQVKAENDDLNRQAMRVVQINPEGAGTTPKQP